MKTIVSTISKRVMCAVAALFVLACVSPSGANARDFVAKKVVKGNFSASGIRSIDVSNLYGNINVTHWNSDKILIEATLSASGSNEKKARKNLEALTVDISKQGQQVVSVTKISGTVKNSDLKIVLDVKIPQTVAADLKNKYGDIYADDFRAALKVDCRYGKVLLGDLTNADIDLAYCNGSVFGDANAVQMDCKYSSIETGAVNSMIAEMSYSNLKMKSINKLSLDMRYGNFSCDKGAGVLDFSSISYSNLKIRRLDPAFKSLAVDCRYSNVSVGVDPTSSFTVDAKGLKYGSCKIKGLKVRNRVNEADGFDSNKAGSSDYSLEVNSGKGGHMDFDGNGYSKFIVSPVE